MKTKTVFAQLKSGGPLYVRLDAVMHPLCAFADGLELTFFGKNRTPYMTCEKAALWVENELRSCPADSRRVLQSRLDALRSAIAKADSGQVVDA